ncbi:MULTISPECIES: TauD/TfdA dioxygenase family protein [unclassified Nocardiopsis]|uniref:TauD/TfdA dioxygenase family protein n=1 Tax=Nocardiopsis TaxID=2013 RepID=UPI00387ADB14
MSTTTDLTVRRVAGRIGAEISGVRIGPDLAEETVAEIRRTLLANKVIFFRDQQHLTDETQAGFAALLGPLTTPHPTTGKAFGKDHHVLPIDSERGKANSWHTDVTFVDRPPQASVLRAIHLPPHGGDTVWANTATAYEDLPQSLKDLADGLRAVHTNDYDYAAVAPERELGEDLKKYREEFVSILYKTEHPVVRVHPETGERVLFLGHFAQHFSGLSTKDFTHLFELFQHRVTRPENTVRWSWREGDVAVWDNRATQHYAVADYGDEPRLLHRITVGGDVPVGVDGRPSRALVGDSSEFTPAL